MSNEPSTTTVVVNVNPCQSTEIAQNDAGNINSQLVGTVIPIVAVAAIVPQIDPKPTPNQPICKDKPTNSLTHHQRVAQYFFVGTRVAFCGVLTFSLIFLVLGGVIGPMLGVLVLETSGYRNGTCLVLSLDTEPKTPQGKMYYGTASYKVVLDTISLSMRSVKTYTKFNVGVPCWYRGSLLSGNYDLRDIDMISIHSYNIQALLIWGCIFIVMGAILSMICLLGVISCLVGFGFKFYDRYHRKLQGVATLKIPDPLPDPGKLPIAASLPQTIASTYCIRE
jgi:hypothetical protein